MAAQEPSFADIAQKAEQDLQELAEEDKSLAALEAELRSAEERAALAEERYHVATRQQAKELSEPLYDEKTALPSGGEVEKPFDKDAEADSAENAATEKHHKGTKNAAAMSDKAVSSQRWLAKRAQETRVRDATKRSRERLRRIARDKKADFADGLGDEVEAAAPAAKDDAPPVKEAAKPRELVSGATPIAAEGALGISDRLKSIKESDAAAKRSAFAQVLTGGRDNYYTFDPSDVVADLQERNLIDAAMAAEFAAIVEAAAPVKGKRLKPTEWLAHAQKVASAGKLEETPFKEAELTYLKSVEDKALVAVEKELAAAEAHLQSLIVRADALKLEDDSPSRDRPRAGSGEIKVDQDYAEQLEEQHGLKKESHGGKNTSAMTEKQVSCKKWEANRDQEQRDREQGKKARDARREEARDLKQDAANAPDDA